MWARKDARLSLVATLGLLLALHFSLIFPYISPFTTSTLLCLQTIGYSTTARCLKNKSARVVIITIWTHYPDMMTMQLASLRKFLQHDFLYLAVGNSNLEEVNLAIERLANENSVEYYHHASDETNPSWSHASAINDAVRYLLQPDAMTAGEEGASMSNDANTGTMLKNYRDGDVMLRPSDMLLLLDSDMFIAAPLNFHQELGGNHLLTHVQWRNGHSRRVFYMWPNFSLFYFGDLHSVRALELFEELDFGCFCQTDGAIMDSGACTAPFLDKHHHELGIVDFVRSCSISNEGEDRSLCAFLASQDSIQREAQCVTSYTLENEILALNPRCSHIEIPNMDAAWQPQDSNNLTDTSSLLKQPCGGHGKIYHLGSAGSNWRGCPEAFMQDQRERFFAYLNDLVEK